MIGHALQGSNRRHTRIGTQASRLILGAIAIGALLVLAAPAKAGVVTYTSTDVPKAFDDGQTIGSDLTVPPDRTPAIDVDVTPLNAFTPPGSADRVIFLQGPNGQTSTLVPPGCNTFSVNINFDDQAPGNPFSDCNPTAGSTRKPASPLSPLLGPAAGTWSMTAADPGNLLQAGPGSIEAWSLRITHAPPTLEIAAAKQKLRKKLTFTATSNADGTLVSSGGVTATTTQLIANQPTPIAAGLRKALLKRLAKKLKNGKKPKVSVQGTFTDSTNDVVADTATAKLSADLTR
jgi:hypothetical protein